MIVTALVALAGAVAGWSAAVLLARVPSWTRPPLGAGWRVGAALAGGALCGLVGLRPAYLFLAVLAVALTIVDLRVHRLPDWLVLPSYPVFLALLALDRPDWLRVLLCGLALFAVYYLLSVVTGRALGFGDVKLAGLLGAALGAVDVDAVFAGTFLAFVYGGVTAIALLIARRADRSTRVPFGPCMLAGALTVILVAA